MTTVPMHNCSINNARENVAACFVMACIPVLSAATMTPVMLRSSCRLFQRQHEMARSVGSVILRCCLPLILFTLVGVSAAACRSGTTACGRYCKNLQKDPWNCGACSKRCAVGMLCVGGACTCPFGGSVCNNRCMLTQVDPRNCGTCKNVCKPVSVDVAVAGCRHRESSNHPHSWQGGPCAQQQPLMVLQRQKVWMPLHDLAMTWQKMARPLPRTATPCQQRPAKKLPRALSSRIPSAG